MKIMMLTGSFLPRVGGAENAVHNIANSLVTFGHEVIILNSVASSSCKEACYKLDKYYILRGAHLYGYHRFPIWQFQKYQLQKKIEKHMPDIIMAHFGWPVGVWLGHIKLKIPYTITAHGPALNITNKGPRVRFNYKIDSLIARSMNKAVAAIAISKHAQKVMIDIGVKKEKIKIIPNGVDVRKFTKISSFDLKGFFGIPKHAKVILSVGRESYSKAYDVAISAFSKIKNKDIYYIILGRNTSKWKEYAILMGCGENVITCEGLYGEALVGAFQQCDIFTLPSIKELCPLVIPEAMAAGRPVICTDVSGSQDMIEDGVNGLIVEPGNPYKLTEAWLELLENIKSQEIFSEVNLGLATKYDWSEISKRHLNCFMEY